MISGRVPTASASASVRWAASPTTRRFGQFSINIRNPARTMPWSSTSKRRIASGSLVLIRSLQSSRRQGNADDNHDHEPDRLVLYTVSMNSGGLACVPQGRRRRYAQDRSGTGKGLLGTWGDPRYARRHYRGIRRRKEQGNRNAGP